MWDAVVQLQLRYLAQHLPATLMTATTLCYSAFHLAAVCSGVKAHALMWRHALHRSEQERVRWRDLISALRSRREQMLATLKRDGRSSNRLTFTASRLVRCKDLSYSAANEKPR